MLASSAGLSRTHLVVILLVVLVLGFLFTIQVRSQAVAEQYLEQQDNVSLGLLITGLSQANNRLVLARVDLAEQQQRLTQDVQSKSTEPPSLSQELNQLQVVNGNVPVSGPGVQLQIGFKLQAFELQDLANVLRQLGAEAIAINGRRVTARTAFVDSGGHVEVDEEAISAPFTVSAIGDPTALGAGGQDIVAQLKPRGAVTLQQIPTIRIAAVVAQRPVVYGSFSR